MKKTLKDVTTYIHRDQLPELKRAYARAIRNKQETFTFNGAEVVTNYGKYLIEYFEAKK